MYFISDYTYHKARRIGVEVKPSTIADKKLDVYKDGNKIASVGIIGAPDYPTYMALYGSAYAYGKKIDYLNRYKREIYSKWSNRWLIYQLLW